MSATPSPSPVFRVTDPVTGLPLVGAKIYTYVGGTASTDKDTWADAAQATLNANPVLTDANGEAQIYLDGDYKFVVHTPDDELLYEIDHVIGGTAAFDRPASGVTLLPFDDIAAENVQAALEELGASRVKITDVIDIDRGGTGQATAHAALDALSQTDYVDVASVAGVTDIGAAASQKVRITGTNTITGFGTVDAGTERDVIFAAALSLTYNATSMQLIGGRSITTGALDRAKFVSLGSGNWRMVRYAPYVTPNQGYRYIGRQVFTADGTYTPTAGARLARIRGCGGGGGGGGAHVGDSDAAAGASGGSGAESGEFDLDLTSVSSATIDIGAKGTGGASSGADGTDGADTTITVSAVVIARFKAGKKGQGRDTTAYSGRNGAPGGSGGTIPTGGVLFPGGGSGAGVAADGGSSAENDAWGGHGGDSRFGGGGPATYTTATSTAAGVNGLGYGAGGSGACATDSAGAAGGDGTDGIVIIEEYA